MVDRYWIWGNSPFFFGRGRDYVVYTTYVREPQGGGSGVDAVGGGFVDALVADALGFDLFEDAGRGQADLFLVYGFKELLGPFDHVQAVEDPACGACQIGGDAVDAVFVGVDQGGELVGFLDGGEVAAVAVFAEAAEVFAVGGHLLDDRGDLVALE